MTKITPARKDVAKSKACSSRLLKYDKYDFVTSKLSEIFGYF